MKKRQLSRSLRWSLENIATSSSMKQRTQDIPRSSQLVSMSRKSTDSKNFSSREQTMHRRKYDHRTFDALFPYLIYAERIYVLFIARLYLSPTP